MYPGKIQNMGPALSSFLGQIESAALYQFVYVSVQWIFQAMALSDGRKNGIRGGISFGPVKCVKETVLT